MASRSGAPTSWSATSAASWWWRRAGGGGRGLHLYALHVHNQGNVALIVLLTLLMTLVAVNLGIFLSMFATTEFQAVQFIPLAIVPQVLLSGSSFRLPPNGWLQVVSRLLPLTYGVDGCVT